MTGVSKLRIALGISGLLSATLFPPFLVAGDDTGDIIGHLAITRALTPLRVVLPVYEVRGVMPQSQGPGAVDEWARVAIYLEGVPDAPSDAVSATLDQRGERFEPELVVVPAGSTVTFPNSDPIFHNVFSLSGAREFDLGFYPAGETRRVRFDEPGIVQVYCHLHPDMNAAIVVAPNSWYTQPDESGRFSLSGIPPGTYTLVVWHRTAGFFRRQVVVPSAGAVEVSVEIPLEIPGDGR
jgi:plastocyanin